MKTWTVASGPLFPGLSRAPVMVTFSFSELLELSPAPAPGPLSRTDLLQGSRGAGAPFLPLSFQSRCLSSTILLLSLRSGPALREASSAIVKGKEAHEEQ